MGVICFASLKGGVGKTSLSLNVAGAFAERGCQTLLIDLDPSGHATRFFLPPHAKNQQLPESPIARLFLSADPDSGAKRTDSVVESALTLGVSMITPVRPRLALLPAGAELRHLLWGRGARAFSQLFPVLVEELLSSYDYIVIDTPPDYNVLTRNAIAVSSLVSVPVDPSAMSIHCLEDIIASSQHIKGPTWSILRTMVNRQASRLQRLSSNRLRENLRISASSELEPEEEDEYGDSGIENADHFISMFDRPVFTEAADGQNQNPIYLLDHLIYRSELQNKLTFTGKLAFDTRETKKLAEQYLAVAKELDEILAYLEEAKIVEQEGDYLSSGADILGAMSR